MPRENRLDRIYTGLTALERAKLVMKTWHDGTKEDPGWRLTMPQRQGHQFNEYIYVMNAANMHVAGMINGLDADLHLLWERALRFELLVEWLDERGDNAPSGPRVAQRRAQPAEGGDDADRRPALCDAINDLSESLVTGLGNLWTSMRMVEVGLENMTATFDGTDPLKPAHRQRLVNVRRDLELLIECIEEYDLMVERREADEELIRWVQGTVPAMRYMMG